MWLQKVDRLMTLLDDEDESVAVEVMAELLDNSSVLDEYLATYQESPNPLIRKRIHQLQSALTHRKRRQGFSKILQAKNIDLLSGLIDLHLLWLDSDSKGGILADWQSFLARADKFKPDTLKRLSLFMRRCEMRGDRESVVISENYCLGEVLLNRVGASSLLCAIVQFLGARFGVNLSIAKVLGEFVLYEESSRNVLIPWQDWSIRKVRRIAKADLWDTKAVLKFIGSMLFSHAVSSDSFRYVMTIGQALTGVVDGEIPEGFPYPYYPADDWEEEEDNENSQPQ